MNTIQLLNRLKDRNHVIASLDAEKAFDETQRPFRLKSPREYGCVSPQHGQHTGSTSPASSNISSKTRSKTRTSRLSLHFLHVLIFGLLEVLARAAWQLKELNGRHTTKSRVQACVLFEDGILPYLKYLWGVFVISLSSFLRHGPVCRSTCRCERHRDYPCMVQRTQQEGMIDEC